MWTAGVEAGSSRFRSVDGGCTSRCSRLGSGPIERIPTAAPMTPFDPFEDAVDGGEDALRELHRWLTYEGVTALAGALVWVLPGVLGWVLAGSALLFTPYLVWQLAQAGWRGALGGFGAMVVAPTVVLGTAFGTIGVWIGLALFYLYTWGLRHVVGEHLHEAAWMRLYRADDA